MEAILKRFGYAVVRQRHLLNPFTMSEGLRRLSVRCPGVRTVIDVGASNGSWTRMCRRHFAEARYHLIEAQPVHKNALETYTATNPNLTFCLSAAGARIGVTRFDASSETGGAIVTDELPSVGTVVEVPVTTIDAEVDRLGLSGPFLLKLDTHGHEVPILSGAEQALTSTAALVIEVYNFQLQKTSKRFWELVSYLVERGFAPIDLVDPMLRPGDSALWQMDLFFLPASHPIFSRTTFE